MKLKKIAQVITPTLCVVCAAIYTQFMVCGMNQDHIKAVSFIVILAIAALLWSTSFVINAMRPAHKNIWIVSSLQIILSSLATWLIVKYEARWREVRMPDVISGLFNVVFCLVEAYQLAQLFTYYSESLDNYIDALHEQSAEADSWEGVLRTILLVLCLACCIGASLFFALAVHRAEGFIGTIVIGFTGGAVIVLCIVFIVAVFILPRGSVLVACLTVFFAAAQIACLTEIRADESYQSHLVNHQDKDEPWGFANAINSFVENYIMEKAPDDFESKQTSLVHLHLSVIVAGIFALISVLLCNIDLMPPDESAVEEKIENMHIDWDDPTTLQRVKHALRCARSTLAPAWPCFIAFRCVPACHPSWVLLQLIILGGYHLLHITSYELRLFPHED